MTEWKAVVGFEGLYEVSNTGLVRNRKGKTLSPYMHRERYLKVSLYNSDGVKKNFPVHRVVAIAFIPNPLGLSDVNHKDLNCENNNVENLEWLSHEDNYQHYLDWRRSNET
jgi:hypothetical protein